MSNFAFLPDDFRDIGESVGRAAAEQPHGRFRGNVTLLKARNHDNGIEISPFTAVPELQPGHMGNKWG